MILLRESRIDMLGFTRRKAARKLIKHAFLKPEIFTKIFNPMKSWGLLAGDYLEFGVYKGRNFIDAYQCAQRVGAQNMHFYAFDSFEGLPEVKGADSMRFSKGDYASSKENFIASLKKRQVDLSKVTIIDGFFQNTLTPHVKKSLPLKHASIVYIDCDIYESALAALTFIKDYLTSGTMIVFDDWFVFGGNPCAGEIKAMREWLGSNPNITLEPYKNLGMSGKIFLVQKWN